MNRYQFFEKLKFRENVIDGKREQHVGKIQRIYDITKSEAKEQASNWQKIHPQGIVTKIDVLEAKIKRLGAIYQRKLAALNELKKSILMCVQEEGKNQAA